MIKVVLVYASNLLALGLSSWLLFPELPHDARSLLLTALVLTALNLLLRPLLMLVALPLNLLSLGLFVLLINAWMVMLADLIVKGWQMPGFWPALLTGALVLICNQAARKIARPASAPGRF